MISAAIVLRAYYERLHELMAARRAALLSRIDELLDVELANRGFVEMDGEKLAAYREACVAFIDERQEAYNPIGIQYTFDQSTTRGAAELEFELNWYNSRAEFADLVAAARSLATEEISDEALPVRVEELIRRAGAFPDRSILAGYRAGPTLQKLPDYIVACVLEEVVCGRTEPL